MATAQAPSGRRIWQAVREELTLNLYPLPFSTLAVVLAQLFVAAPLFVRSARLGFMSVDK